MAEAGLGDDLLLANEVVDATRLGALVRGGARVTVAVDSDETIDAAAAAGVPEVLIDVTSGSPAADAAPRTPDGWPIAPGAAGLEVRGVMGYEGHLVGLDDRAARTEMLEASMALLIQAHRRGRAARSSRRAAPAPTTSTAGPPRSRPAPTPSWTPPTASSAFPSPRRSPCWPR